MKLLRYGDKGSEKPGLWDGSAIRDLSAHVGDIDGTSLAPASLSKLAAIDPSSLPVVEGSPRLGPCVGNIGKLACVGLNYRDHATETGNPIPEEPVLFGKAVSSVCGPNDDVEMPRGSTMLDWEVELAIVIGSETKNVSEEDAMDHVAGFAVFNDVSERDFQINHGGQWMKGKSHDTFGPLGPWMVTKDEIADVGNLDMWLDVSGTRRQTGNTKTFIFQPAFVVSYISRFMSLQPGDVIPTGTPPGVGMGMRPQVFLKNGDVMELGIQGLGEQRLPVVEM
ncbi:MAG: fumarylacetoacetate hydrolase family protein [Pseudomonadota bacterium]